MKKNGKNSSPTPSAPPDGCIWYSRRKRFQAKGWAGAVLLAAILLAACAGIGPESLPPMTASAPGLSADRCAAFFPKGRWQMTHAIHFRLADGTAGNALGVLLLDGRSLSCALMTVEGLTLFASRSPDNGSLEILRALPPFDKKTFAEGLIADIRTLFQPPAGMVSLGRLADGGPLCRFVEGHKVTDVLPQADGCFQLATYAQTSASDSNIPVRTRTVVARDCNPVGGSLVPRDITLTGHGAAGYTLQLHLLSAEPLPAANP